LVNARDAIPETGTISIELSNTAFSEDDVIRSSWLLPGEYVLLAVSDNGSGMDQETLSHLFEPFFTTKEVGKGTGLGLATVYGIVKQNNGFINVYSDIGKGTTFKIYLPRCVTQPASIPAVFQETAPPKGQETILIVEDEESLLEIVKDTLEDLGYTVMAANTASLALRLAEEHAKDIRLLITDVVMPEMDGRKLAEKIRSIQPDIKCLFMSGYTADIIANHGILDEGVFFIQKPFPLNTLAVKVRQALA
ncbi:MAG: response regulator, partial [Chloroflexota bacterium]